MTISYDADLDDVAEVHIRGHWKTRRAGHDRWAGSVMTGLCVGTLTYVLPYLEEINVPIPFIVLAGFLGALLTYGAQKPLIRKQIRRNIKGAYRDADIGLPLPTKYTLQAGVMECHSKGIGVSFKLSDLSSITEDDKFIELRFRNIGLAVIPQHAFETPEKKREFLDMLNSDRTA